MHEYICMILYYNQISDYTKYLNSLLYQPICIKQQVMIFRRYYSPN